MLLKRVSELKETEGGTGSMCEALEELMKEMGEEMRQKGVAQGEARGKLKERRKMAKALFQRGMPIKEIAEVIGEKEAAVESWLELAGQ